MHGSERVWPSGRMAGFGLARWNRVYKKQTIAIIIIDSAIKNGGGRGAKHADARRASGSPQIMRPAHPLRSLAEVRNTGHGSSQRGFV